MCHGQSDEIAIIDHTFPIPKYDIVHVAWCAHLVYPMHMCMGYAEYGVCM